jgi:hypothetical protein
MVTAVLIVSGIGFLLLRGHPFLRTWLACSALWAVFSLLALVGSHDPAVAGDEVTVGDTLVFAPIFGLFLAAIIRGLARAFGGGSGSLGDTSTIGWYKGPNNPTGGRFD